jgi:hypothetical protein
MAAAVVKQSGHKPSGGQIDIKLCLHGITTLWSELVTLQVENVDESLSGVRYEVNLTNRGHRRHVSRQREWLLVRCPGQ